MKTNQFPYKITSFNLKTFISKINHEINNPLAIIYGNIELIEQKNNSDDIKSIHSIKKAVFRIKKTLDTLNYHSEKATSIF